MLKMYFFIKNYIIFNFIVRIFKQANFCLKLKSFHFLETKIYNLNWA